MKKFLILIPLYNDWKSCSRLVSEIDTLVINWNAEVSIIISNDASTEKRSGFLSSYKKIKSIKILNIKENNGGSARPIAVGLKYINKNENFDWVIVMDADGEDRPEELNDFFNMAQQNPGFTITGNRFKRSEGIIFKISYQIHKILTLIFTGKLIKFGNFTCLPREHVNKLVQKPYLWNTYSSSVFKTITNRLSISAIRGTRYVLPSKMNFKTLVFHSLTIISVFKKEVILRSFAISVAYFFLIFNNISVLTILPFFFLLIFLLTVLKISMRGNTEELDRSLENISNIDVLGSSDNG